MRWVRLDYFVAAFLAMTFFVASCAKRQDPVESLLSQMTIEEKCGQLTCPIGFNFYGKEDDSLWLADDFLVRMDTMPLGACWAVLRADPWSKKTVETGLHPHAKTKEEKVRGEKKTRLEAEKKVNEARAEELAKKRLAELEAKKAEEAAAEAAEAPAEEAAAEEAPVAEAPAENAEA